MEGSIVSLHAFHSSAHYLMRCVKRAWGGVCHLPPGMFRSRAYDEAQKNLQREVPMCWYCVKSETGVSMMQG